MLENIYADDVYVTGSNGLVGSNFCEFFRNKYGFITPEIESLDITNFESLEEYFSCMKLKAIINFAALTDVDGAEKEKGNMKGSFWQVNLVGATNLARLAKKMDAQMIQISTDFVFPGNDKITGPYTEYASPPNSDKDIGWYGWTKRMAEKEIQNIIKPAIVRIAFPFGDRTSPKDYLNKIIAGIKKGYPLFANQFITPTYLPDLFLALEKIIEGNYQGVYHVATSPVTTPFEIGYALNEKLGLGLKLKEGSIKDFMQRLEVAPRPVKGGLLAEETQRKLGLKFHSWQEGLDAWL